MPKSDYKYTFVFRLPAVIVVETDENDGKKALEEARDLAKEVGLKYYGDANSSLRVKANINLGHRVKTARGYKDNF